jgi:hypothetical protein
MLKATEQEIEQIRGYFDWQATNLSHLHAEGLFRSRLNARHDVCDIHIDEDQCCRRHQPILATAIRKHGHRPDFSYRPLSL